jgi:hypothetical protein
MKTRSRFASADESPDYALTVAERSHRKVHGAVLPQLRAMDDLARFIRDRYLQLEEQESARLSSGSDGQIERHIESAQKLTLERRERFLKAFRREVELRRISVGRYFQPFAGSVILRDGEPYSGRFWINGNYYADEGSLSRAKRVALERVHAAALREDAARLGSTNEKLHSETSEQAEHASLGRSLVASIAIAGIRYEITPKGRDALKSASTFRGKDATGSEPAGRNNNGTHG